MILSHQYRFIFIKTNKTAGTSVEIALSRFCGPDDVITPVSHDDEVLRSETGGRGPQNYKTGSGRRKFYNHMGAAEIRKLVGDDVWDSYFKFCIERNPWDRVISLYYWRNKEEPRPTISEFIESETISALRSKGLELYTIDGVVVVDRILRYENLEEELDEVRRLVGIPPPLELPRAKASFRNDRRPHREVFDDEQRRVIADRFQEEIELLGYEF